MVGIGRFQKRSVTKSTETSSAESVAVAAPTDSKIICNYDTSSLNNGAPGGLELPISTLAVDFDSNFTGFDFGAQSRPGTGVSTSHFDVCNAMSTINEEMRMTIELNEKEGSGCEEEELLGNTSIAEENEVHFVQICGDNVVPTAERGKNQDNIGNREASNEKSISGLRGGSAVRTSLSLYLKNQNEIGNELTPKSPIKLQSNEFSMVEENLAYPNAHDEAKNAIVDSGGSPCDPQNPQENVHLNKDGKTILEVAGVEKLDSKDAIVGIEMFAASPVADDYNKSVSFPNLSAELAIQQKHSNENRATPAQKKRNDVTIQQEDSPAALSSDIDQSQQQKIEVSSDDSKGSLSPTATNKLPHGGSSTSEKSSVGDVMPFMKIARYGESATATALRTDQAPSAEELTPVPQKSQATIATSEFASNLSTSAVDNHFAMSSVQLSKTGVQIQQRLIKQYNSDSQSTVLLNSAVAPPRPALKSAVSKKPHSILKTDSFMATTYNSTRPITRPNQVDSLKQAKKAQMPLVKQNMSHNEIGDTMPPPVAVTPRSITSSSKQGILHHHHLKSPHEGLDISTANPLSIPNSKTAWESPQLSTTTQHSADVSNMNQYTVSKPALVAATVSPAVATTNLDRDDCRTQAQAASKCGSSESFDCLLTNFLMDIRDVQDNLDVSSTAILDMEVEFAEIYNQALDMQGKMIDSIEEIDAAMRYAEDTIAFTKEWV
jgi:hypothetical protein